MSKISDYIVYVDESGDAILNNICASYPVLTLVFCIFNKTHYENEVLPKINHLKQKYWGNTDIVLHEREIRKSEGENWEFLKKEYIRENFLNDLNEIIENMQVDIIATVIDKNNITDKYEDPFELYEMALLLCLERLNGWLKHKKQKNREIPVYFEARGRKEDERLELEFYRIIAGKSTSLRSRNNFQNFSYNAEFLKKKNNIIGLQIADLFARPIGLSVVQAEQQNRAFDIIKEKFIDIPEKKIQGLKIFPDN